MRHAIIDLVRLYLLFSLFRPHHGTPENCFFRMLLHAAANLCINYDRTLENIMWSELGKQNVQARKVF